MKQIFFTAIAVWTLTFVSVYAPENAAVMTAEVNPDNGQFIVRESGKPILQYNYQTAYEDDVVRPESQKGKKTEYSPVSGVYLDEYYRSNPAVSNDGKATSFYRNSGTNIIQLTMRISS
jgi:hypothetical protein